ncbi:hypothetical protein CF328_g4348 [Tilletia controversa]|nr:hypothetical protein CF328_g4348 [Tilletia controversa]
MTVDTSTDLPTKLITLINVSAARPDTAHAKRARLAVPFHKITHADPRPKIAALLKQQQQPQPTSASTAATTTTPAQAIAQPDPFHLHFASLGQHGRAASALAAQAASSSSPSPSALPAYTLATHTYDAIGPILQYDTPHTFPSTQDRLQETVRNAYHAHLQATHRRAPTPLQRSTLNVIQSYADLLHPHLALSQRDQVRETVAAHLLSHLQKTRRVILRNNERLAKAAASDGGKSRNSKGASADDMDLDVQDDEGEAGEAKTNDDLDELVRDQGFTRPKILVLLPLRNSALAWTTALSSVSGCVEGLLSSSSEEAQSQSAKRFLRDFTLPEGTLDRLAQPDAGARFPADHVATFQGNIDDSFVLGFKVTRKEWRAYARYYGADIIVASPLGLRLAIEKDNDSDFLSSIEIVVADQLDVMQMQNWEHVKFVFSQLNHIPRKVHESTDFARVRQWSLDGASAYLRQTILLSSLDTPEVRALFAPLRNLAGRRRVLSADDGTKAGKKEKEGAVGMVRDGVRQVFVKFDCANVQAEADVRLAHFTTKTLPALLKSAIASSKTLIFVPSYFDFVLLVDHLQKLEEKGELRFTSISEYSNNREIARAREAFFSGKKDFLIITERFHFYRRYVLRGARTLVFYGLPLHSGYYAELAGMPFAVGQGKGEGGDEGEGAVDPSDVSIQSVFCQYDFLRLEGVVGRKRAMGMCGIAAAGGNEEDGEEGQDQDGRRFGEARVEVGEEEERDGVVGVEERDGPSKKTWRFV